MRVKITVKTDNAAFSENGPGAELARILRRLAEKLEAGPVQNGTRLLDSNGNTVGFFTVWK